MASVATIDAMTANNETKVCDSPIAAPAVPWVTQGSQTIRDEMVEINGQRLHVTDTGGQGAVLLFAHGNQMDNSMWSRVIDLLRNDFRCIAVGCCAFRAGIAVTGSSLFQEWIGWLYLDDHIGLAEFLRTQAAQQRG